MKRQELDQLSLLARISLSDNETRVLLGKISPVLDYVGELQAFSKTVNASADTEVGVLYNVSRPDQPVKSDQEVRQALLKAFPATKNNYLQVKKIIG